MENILTSALSEHNWHGMQSKQKSAATNEAC